jgi:hypothetical protein
MTNRIITQEELKYLLTYDSETGTFTWNIKPRNGINAGDIVTAPENRYKQFKIYGKQYLLHHLAWLYVYGELPEQSIDHVNRIKNDNRISNLRLATAHQQCCNRGKFKNNKAGYKGVHWVEANQKFRAMAKLLGRSVHIGFFESAIEASNAYIEFAKKNYGSFYAK